MKEFLANLSEVMERNAGDIYAVSLLVGFSFVGYLGAVHLVPAISDEYLMLTSVSRAANPFSYFVGDWGMGSHFYRPLLSLSFWILYHMFGVANGPNQLLSIAAQAAVIVLLYRTIRLYLSDIPLAFLFSAIPLFSINTIFSVIFTPDRCSIFVGISFVLLFGHILAREKKGVSMDPLYVVFLCAVALMSKESGVVVVALAFAANLKRSFPFVNSRRLLFGIVALMAGYAVLRYFMFGDKIASYPVECYLFGLFRADPERFPGLLKAVLIVDNSIKNIVGVFLPIYSSEGKLYLLRRAPYLILAAVVYLFTLNRDLNRTQKLALFAVIVNAVVHWATFRCRTLYVAQLAAAVFLSSSPRLLNPDVWRKWAVRSALILIFGMELFWVQGQISESAKRNFKLIYENKLDQLKSYMETDQIDPEIVRRVLERHDIHNGF